MGHMLKIDMTVTYWSVLDPIVRFMRLSEFATRLVTAVLWYSHNEMSTKIDSQSFYDLFCM